MAFKKKAYGIKRRQGLRKRKPLRKVTAKPSKNIQRYVKKTIHRMTENKMRQNGGVLSLLPTTHTSYQTNCIIPLTPYYEAGLSSAQNIDIVQGTSISGRIANRIRTASGYFRAVIFPLQYNVSTNPLPQPLDVTMWIFKLKSGLTDSTGGVLNALQTNWFKFGSSSVGVANSVADVVNIPNPDIVNVLYRKTFKLGCASNTGTGGQAGFEYHANNDYKFNHIIKMNVTKYLRKNIHYVDNSSTPSTATTWMCFTIGYASGASMTNSTVPANIQWEYDYRYEDL